MSFVDIEEYMKKDRDERRSHLDLEEPCVEIGGDSRQFRSHLAFHLGTTLPRGMRVHLCHACNNDRCANPKHHYWGNPSDNLIDQYEAGTRKSAWEYKVANHGLEKAREMQRKLASKAGKVGGGHNKLSKAEIAHRRKIIIECQPHRYGWVARASKALGVSHTHVRRLVKEEMSDLKTFQRKKSV